MRRMKIGIGFIVMILLCLMAVAAMGLVSELVDSAMSISRG